MSERSINIISSINDPASQNKCFFMDGPAGTGKTFVYNILIPYLQLQGIKVVSVAYTGIAATSLKGGRTAHSLFKLPILLNETSCCKVKNRCDDAMLLKNAKLIIMQFRQWKDIFKI